MQKLFDFYMLENVDELVEEHNKLIRLSMKMENYSANYEIEVQENEEGLYKIPKPNYKYKKFKNDKRNWSCTCDWCGKKVSSKTDEAYYTLNCSIFNIGLEHACSRPMCLFDLERRIQELGIRKRISEILLKAIRLYDVVVF
jgi:hypothetical protein